MLQVGQKAPPFQLPDADMYMVDSSDYLDKKNLVLYFYPKDDTTGCTIEAVELSDLMDDFEKLDTLVFGISRDNCLFSRQARADGALAGGPRGGGL